MRSPGSGVGPLLREWRHARRLSQLELANVAEVSTRHLSCVETGRARPSAELVLHLASHLDVPLRSRNQLLLAAGYAPAFPERGLDDAAMAPLAAMLDTVVERSAPNPVVVVDRCWNLVRANAPALWLCSGIDDALLEPPINLVRISIDPAGLKPRIVNFDEYARHLEERVRASASATRDPQLLAMAEDLRGLCGGIARPDTDGPPFAVPLEIDVAGRRLSLFSTIATFGAPTDVGTSELSIETFYPADDATASTLATAPWA